MPDFSPQNRTFLGKIEASSGTDAAPVVGTDAIKAEAPKYAYNFETDDTNEVNGGLDQSPQYTGGGDGTFTIPVLLKGSGTGGQAPECAPMLRSAAMSQTLVASDVTDSLQSGSGSDLVLAVGEISADSDYVGAVIRITDGALDGYVGVITASVASTDTVTVVPALGGDPGTGTYVIDACAIFRQVSTSLETLTGYLYEHNSGSGDDILRKLIGGATEASFNFPVRKKGRANFQVRGQLVAPTDVSAPGAASYSDAVAPVLVAARTYLDNDAIKYSELSFSLGNSVELADDPSATYGVDVGGVTRRRGTGRINPRKAVVATRNPFADISAGTERSLWLLLGSGDGKQISIWMPSIRFIAAEDAENKGFSHEGLDFNIVGTNTGVYLTFL